MILDELASNSVKYGALSVGAGTVDITCKIQENNVALVWTEHGGPTVSEPSEAGFGSKLVSRMVARLGGTFSSEWAPAGIIVKLDMKKDRLAA